MILDDILAARGEQLARSQGERPLAELWGGAAQQDPPLDFAVALEGPGVRLIAEVKRTSPSQGALRPALEPASLALTYVQNGACAVSVLTEERYFHGGFADLRAIRSALGREGRSVPLLCKDFLFHPYQVYEARYFGADAVLLIALILSAQQLAELLGLSRELGMEALVEVHDEADLQKALAAGARIIGINNRDLRSFAVDLETTRRLAPLVPKERIVVSESGIHCAEDVVKLHGWGVRALLVGESLLRAQEVAAKVRELVEAPLPKRAVP